MANKVNNWNELLKLANEDLSKHKCKITLEEFDNFYTLYIESTTTDKWETYAEGYYEDELYDLINDAWAHALTSTHNVEKLVEAYFKLSDAEKDEFLRMTGNQ